MSDDRPGLFDRRSPQPRPPVRTSLPEHKRRGLAGVLMGAGLLLVAIIFGGITLMQDAGRPPAPLPVIAAPDGPVKERPADPGGQQVPHQDALIYQQLTGDASSGSERLLPPPEEPLANALPAAVAAPNPTPVIPSPSPPVAAAATPVAKPPTTQKAVAPPVADEADGQFRVQLASLPEEERATTEAQRLARVLVGPLAGQALTVNRADLGQRGVTYRIQTAPLTEAAARALCDRLRAATAACVLVRVP